MSQIITGREVDGVELPPVGTWRLDQAHTAVQFVARHILTKVRGRFTGFQGTILVADRPEDSKVDVEIDASTLQTNQDQRDQHLRSGDFLEVETYPAITFRSTEVRPTGGTTLEVVGDLTIKGVTRPVTLEAEYLGQGTNPSRKRVTAFSARTTIDREDWDVTWNMLLESGGLLVSKNVDLELEIEAILED